MDFILGPTLSKFGPKSRPNSRPRQANQGPFKLCPSNNPTLTCPLTCFIMRDVAQQPLFLHVLFLCTMDCLANQKTKQMTPQLLRPVPSPFFHRLSLLAAAPNDPSSSPAWLPQARQCQLHAPASCTYTWPLPTAVRPIPASCFMPSQKHNQGTQQVPHVMDAHRLQ